MTNISLRNAVKIEAETAFRFQNYQKSTDEYENLKSLSYSFEPEARLNLAHGYFMLGDTVKSLQEYRRLLRVKNEAIKSTALVQIAIINTKLGDSTFALQLFKEALQNTPNNSIARYNYEFLKKKLPPPSNNKSNQSQTEQEQEQEVSPEVTEKKEDELQSLKIERMSRDKALQILEAMKSNELQYIQQKKKGNRNKDFKDY